MKMDKKTILAFLLIGLVFLFVQSPIYQKYFFPESYKKQIEHKSSKPVAMDSTKTISNAGKGVDSQENFSAAVDTGKSSLAKDEEIPAREIVVNTEHYIAVFSTRGGSLVSWTLKDFKKADGSLVSMLPENSLGNLGIDFVTRDEENVHTGDWNFECNVQGDMVLNSDSRSLRFVHRIDNQRSITKTFTLKDGRYDLELEIAMENLGSLVADKSYQLLAPNGLSSSEQRLSEDMYYAKAAVAAAGRVNKMGSTKGVLQKENGSIDWVAVRTKYFTYAIIPLTQKAEYATVLGEEFVVAGENSKNKWKKFGIGLGMPLTRESSKDRFTIFLGPMHDDLLKSYQVGLEKLMDMGAKVIQPFSIATLWMFKKIHSVVPNYGIVLIIFSLLIKIITAPLTHKSFQSMKKMQALQPKMAELKEKYGKDPQRLNSETMKLYKEEGVNPMGGCLPIALQMPLLWALYIVFRSTISLRQQGFFWWIKDLSGPDTIYTLPFMIPMYGNSVNVLPILMGLTMILQQKMSVTDPKQKAMIYIMPIFMTLLFNNFPSGLNLYYTLFNIISIVHQKYFMGGDGQSLIPALGKSK
jgi:YidC/Oxa1 family membrane protein insertase